MSACVGSHASGSKCEVRRSDDMDDATYFISRRSKYLDALTQLTAPFPHDNMSADTTALNNACHVLDGMHNDDATKCWVEILRHGVVFRIEALAENLHDTPFHQQWSALFGTETTPSMDSHQVFDRWGQLCDLLINTSLPVLQDIAPEAPADRSLSVCFHTPTYHLQIVRDPVSGAVHASVASGPVDGSPSGCQVAGVGDLDAFAPGLKQYPSRNIEVLEPATSSSFPPRKVRMPDGITYGFKACIRDAKRLLTGHVANHHRDAIHAYLALHKGPLGVPGIPSVSGIVVDEGALAGILLEDIQATGNLPSRMEAVATVEGLEEMRRLVPEWQARIEAVVKQLHGRSYCLNEEVSQSGLDESLLMVDQNDEIWLPLSKIFAINTQADEFRERTSEDEEAVRQVFERFVPKQIQRREAKITY